MASTKLVTIPKDVPDPYFRYKRHVISNLTYVNKNGGTTIIDAKDFDRLCHELERDRKFMLSHLKRELGCALTETSDKRVAIKKEIDVKSIEDAIEKIISNDILCGLCGNPETYEVEKKGRRCKACGELTK